MAFPVNIPTHFALDLRAPADTDATPMTTVTVRSGVADGQAASSIHALAARCAR
ncbi:MAG: hypothetical protein ACLP50_02930 [Solirubrobacteraceae bacterium]